MSGTARNSRFLLQHMAPLLKSMYTLGSGSLKKDSLEGYGGQRAFSWASGQVDFGSDATCFQFPPPTRHSAQIEVQRAAGSEGASCPGLREEGKRRWANALAIFFSWLCSCAISMQKLNRCLSDWRHFCHCFKI